MNEMPEKLQREVAEAARQSSNKRYPPLTEDLASANHGYRMEHGMGFEYGAKFMYASQFRSQPAMQWVKKDDAIGVLMKFYDEGNDLGYSNSELSRIASCTDKIKQLHPETPPPVEVTEEQKMWALDEISIYEASLKERPIQVLMNEQEYEAYKNWKGEVGQEAVAFAEWHEDNKWWRDDETKLWSRNSANWENITTEELYTLFKNQR